MTKRDFVAVAALLVAFLSTGAAAYAQAEVNDPMAVTQSLANVNITFPFVAGGKEMPAGTYHVEVSMEGPVVFRSPEATSPPMQVITLLGRHDQDRDPEFVFDKVNGKMLLSEVWVPGQDGLLLLATKGPHEHAVLGGSNPRK